MEIIIQITAIVIGIDVIYKKKDYEKENEIWIFFALIYSMESQHEIVKWLSFIVAIQVLIIAFGKFFRKRSKCA